MNANRLVETGSSYLRKYMLSYCNIFLNVLSLVHLLYVLVLRHFLSSSHFCFFLTFFASFLFTKQLTFFFFLLYDCSKRINRSYHFPKLLNLVMLGIFSKYQLHVFLPTFTKLIILFISKWTRTCIRFKIMQERCNIFSYPIGASWNAWLR